jgi:hypothetical protein
MTADLCKCGCGGEIVIKPWHKWRGIPLYLHGHCKNSLGRKHSKESKKKMSDALMGRSTWNKGKAGIYSEETLRKIKDARAKQIMKKGRKHSDESKEKNRIAHLGKVQSEESNKKRSIALKGQRRTKEQKETLSKCRLGEKNPAWRGGITKHPYGQDWIEDLKDAIRKRDSYTCQLCGITQEEFAVGRLHKKLPVHHIDYDKKNCNPDNLKTLCISCHAKTGHSREAWKLFFNKIQAVAQDGIQSILMN